MFLECETECETPQFEDHVPKSLFNKPTEISVAAALMPCCSAGTSCSQNSTFGPYLYFYLKRVLLPAVLFFPSLQHLTFKSIPLTGVGNEDFSVNTKGISPRTCR